MTGQEYIDNQELHPLWLIGHEPLKEDVVDAFEQGKVEGEKELLAKSVSEGHLVEWYICSVDETEPPIWTDEHIEELCRDFYIIPKNV